MNKKLGALALLGAAAVVLAGCSGSTGGTPSADTSGFDAKGAKDQDITFWLVGGDTPQALRDYLSPSTRRPPAAPSPSRSRTGATLSRSSTNHAARRQQHPGRHRDRQHLGADLHHVGRVQRPQRHVQRARRRGPAAVVRRGGHGRRQEYTLPYYFGSRYMIYRKDIWEAAGLSVPTTLDEFNTDVTTIAARTRRARLRLLHRRPGLAQRHLVDLRQRRRPREEGRRQVGLDPVRPEDASRASRSSRTSTRTPRRAPGDAEDGQHAVGQHQRHRQVAAAPPHRRHDHGSRLGALVDR